VRRQRKGLLDPGRVTVVVVTGLVGAGIIFGFGLASLNAVLVAGPIAATVGGIVAAIPVARSARSAGRAGGAGLATGIMLGVLLLDTQVVAAMLWFAFSPVATGVGAHAPAPATAGVGRLVDLAILVATLSAGGIVGLIDLGLATIAGGVEGTLARALAGRNALAHQEPGIA
jgi:hypothetical protein